MNRKREFWNKYLALCKEYEMCVFGSACCCGVHSIEDLKCEWGDFHFDEQKVDIERSLNREEKKNADHT